MSYLSSHLQIHQKIKLNIERLGIYGEGIGYWNGITVFVEGSLPTETINVSITEVRKNFARAKLVSIEKPSSYRQNPICPVFGSCGGCQLMHLAYSQQLVIKQQHVFDALKRIGKISDPIVLPCIASPFPLHYRNKIQLPFELKNQNPVLGLYAFHSHELIAIETCYIHCELGEKVFNQTKILLQNFIISNLKYVLIKTAVRTNQVLIIFVTDGEHPSVNSLAYQLFHSMEEIQGVVQNFHKVGSNTVLSSQYKLLIGKDFIQEQVGSLICRISAPSFFQVNPYQAVHLYQKVLEFCDPQGTEIVFDGYCGIGVLSLLLAQKAKEVIGVEISKNAIEDATFNAQQNNCHNIQFKCGKTEELIQSIHHADIIILNPPRKGCEIAVLQQIVFLKPQCLIYVSCDPATLARDLLYLTQNGFNIQYVQPFDMFPQTVHVETVVKLIFSP